jgi:hypothetical protein
MQKPVNSLLAPRNPYLNAAQQNAISTKVVPAQNGKGTEQERHTAMINRTKEARLQGKPAQQPPRVTQAKNVDLLGQALGSTSAAARPKSSLMSRIAKKPAAASSAASSAAGSTASNSAPRVAHCDGSYSGSVPIPQSRLPASSGHAKNNIGLGLEKPDEATVIEQQRQLKARLAGPAVASSGSGPVLNTITNKPKMSKVAAAGGSFSQQVKESSFGAMFGGAGIDLEAVKEAKSIGHGALEQMEQLKRTEKLEALAYKETREEENGSKRKNVDARLVVRYFCDTCKDGVGREFVLAKCKKHAIRTSRVLQERQEDIERRNRKYNGRDGEGMVLGTGIEWNGASVRYMNDGSAAGAWGK